MKHYIILKHQSLVFTKYNLLNICCHLVVENGNCKEDFLHLVNWSLHVLLHVWQSLYLPTFEILIMPNTVQQICFKDFPVFCSTFPLTVASILVPAEEEHPTSNSPVVPQPCLIVRMMFTGIMCNFICRPVQF